MTALLGHFEKEKHSSRLRELRINPYHTETLIIGDNNNTVNAFDNYRKECPWSKFRHCKLTGT